MKRYILLVCAMLMLASYTTYAGPPISGGGAAGSGDFLADGTVPMTGAPIPNAANTIALGSNAAEWADLFLGDGAIIYGQNDSSATLTSSAGVWTASRIDGPHNGTVGATTPAAGTFTSVSVVRADTPQTVTLYEATSDGNNLATLTAPAKGTGYTGDRTVTMPDSSGTVAVLGTSGNVPDAISFSVDGGGSAISTGLKTCMVAKHKMTLTGWTLIADQSGAIKIDVWKDTYANYQPTNADTITNAHEPEIAASGLKAQDTDIADWTTVAIAAGDVVCFNVDSCATITWAHLALTGYRIN